MSFKAIAAMSENRVIGDHGRIPWHLPEDFAWFKRLTSGHTVVMGRKTFESIGGPLPGRTTLVLSRTLQQLPGAHVIAAVEQIEAQIPGGDVFICGGAEVYARTLHLCSDLYLTLVKRQVTGDALFPPFEEQFGNAEVILDRPAFRITHYQRIGSLTQ